MKRKNAAFLALGLSCTVLFAIATQNSVYEYIVAPLANTIQDTIYPNNNVETQQIKAWTNENIKFIQALPKSHEVEGLDSLKIDIKDNHLLIDKFSVLLIEQMQKIKNLQGNDHLNTSKSLSLGLTNQMEMKYNIDDHQIAPGTATLVVGTKFFKDSNVTTATTLKKAFAKAFNNDPHITYDFVNFHEISHFISATYSNGDAKKEYDVISSIVSNIETTQKTKLTLQEKYNITNQYKESIGDVLALEMLSQKYPHLDINYISKEIGKARLIVDDSNHLTTASILAHLDMKPSDKKTSLDTMLSKATLSALSSAQFYSHVSFDIEDSEKRDPRRDIMVKFKNVPDNINKIRHGINEMFAQYHSENKYKK